MNIRPGQLKNYLAKTPAKRKVSHNESALQQSCVKWFDAQYSGIYTQIVATPVKKKGIKQPVLRNIRISALMMLANAGKRTKAGGGYAVAEGLSTGAADLFLSVPQQVIQAGWLRKYGLYIEMKFGDNKQSAAQQHFQKLVEATGYQYEVIYDFDSFKNLVEKYLGKRN